MNYLISYNFVGSENVCYFTCESKREAISQLHWLVSQKHIENPLCNWIPFLD